MEATSPSPNGGKTEQVSSGVVVSGVTQQQRVFRFIAALLVFALCTYYGIFRVHFPPPGLSRGHPFTARWWLWPLEFNSASRMNHVEPAIEFNCITATPDKRHIWMAGQAGMILHSDDGGETWIRLPKVGDDLVTPKPATPTPSNSVPPSATPPSKKKASIDSPVFRYLALTAANERDEWIRVSADGKQQQTGKTKDRPGDKSPLTQLDPNAPLQGGTPSPPMNLRGERALTSPGESGGGNDSVSVPPFDFVQLESNNVIDLSFVSPTVGYALTAEGELLSTHDGGNSWQLLPALRKTKISSSKIRFIDERRGVAAGGDGLAATFDAGETWIGDPNFKDVTDFVLTEGLDGWAIGQFSGPLQFFVNAKGFRDSLLREGSNLNGIAKTSDGTLFACGDGGLLLTLRGYGREPAQANVSDTREDLSRIVFPSDTTGYVFSNSGLILATNNGGKDWEQRRGPLSGQPTAVFFSSENEGLLAVDGGAVSSTNDGGRNWTPLVVSSPAPLNGFDFWLPAPWYLLALCFLVGFVRRIPDETPILPITGIAGLLLSDKPIETADADYLGFRKIALGLSNYLRNNATNPPLTVAVTGDWGMGKSSLMNLLESDLENYGFKAVKFNAWHHQTEESLLAALLGNVRSQAIPSIFKREGVTFRIKLLWLRARKNILAFLLVVAGAAFCVGYFAADIGRLTNPASLTQLLNALNGPKSLIEQLTEHWSQIGKFLAVAVATIGSLVGFLKAFRPFGVDPSSLLASKSNAAKSKDLRAQTSFRYQFSQEFREVTESLNPLSMVLFVDDVDRCRPEQVYDMLEAINFLVSCGDCFVVMGFARRRVERCIGLVFEKVAAERPDKPNEPKLDEPQKREKFAKDYLEKLINIEVAVPVGSMEQIQELLTNKPLEVEPPSRMEMADRWIRKWGSSLFLALIACVVGWIALSSSMRVFPRGETKYPTADIGPAPPPVSFGAKVEATPPDQSPEEKAQWEWLQKRQKANAEADNARQLAVFTPASKVGLWLWMVLLGAGALVGLGIIRLSRRPNAIVEDSPEFVSALNEWAP
ncbi:MAG TPA: P-loop NTPase fold protein, partial [Chthoniobacterales bacterium]